MNLKYFTTVKKPRNLNKCGKKNYEAKIKK